jgi:hypothetical protein
MEKDCEKLFESLLLSALCACYGFFYWACAAALIKKILALFKVQGRNLGSYF